MGSAEGFSVGALVVAEDGVVRGAPGLVVVSPGLDGSVAVEDQYPVLHRSFRKMPFACSEYKDGQSQRDWPYFVASALNSSFQSDPNIYSDNPPLAPTTYDWNTTHGYANVLYEEPAQNALGWEIHATYRVRGKSYYNPYASDQHARYYMLMQPLIWGCNQGFAKYLAKENTAHKQIVMSMDDVPSSNFQGFTRKHQGYLGCLPK